MNIKSSFDHYNFNVLDLEKSINFYKKALGLKEVSRVDDKNFTLVYLGDGETGFRLELTKIEERKESYNLGECEFHLCMRVSGDYDSVRKYHKEMDCVVFENEEMGLYFITDPDGYWIEILPKKN